MRSIRKEHSTAFKKYDLSQIGKVIVGGDGASWVKEGAELLGGLYELEQAGC